MQKVRLKATTKNLKLIIWVVGLLIGVYLFFQGLDIKEQSSSIQAPQIPHFPQNSIQTQIASNSAQIIARVPMGFIQAQVVKVIDGDTIDVQLSGEIKRVRYIGVDTPETVDPRRGKQCFGKEASDENKKLVQGNYVFLEKDISETDKYDRLLRYVYLSLNTGDFLMVNDYLVRQGFAHSSTYPPDVKHQQRLLEAQEEARQNIRGFWASCE